MPKIAPIKALSRGLRVLDAYLMGYDVFISYTWLDGRDYAEALEAKLKEKRYRCFLDSSEYQVGDDLNRDARRAVKWSRAAAIVVTENALASKHVRKEIGLFEASQKPIVPIDINSSLYERIELEDGAVAYQLANALTELRANSDEGERQEIDETFGLISRDSKLQIEDPRSDEPSIETIERLCERFNFTRKVSRRLRIIGATCILLVTLAVLALLARNEAENQREHAEQNLAEAIGVAKTITEEIDHELEDVPGAEPVRDKLLGSAYDMLEGLLERAPSHPKVKAAQADAAQNLGTWHFRHRSLEIAKERFEEALAFYRENPIDKEKVVQCLLNLGRTNRDLRNLDEATRNYKEVLTMVASIEPANQSSRFKAQALYGLGDIFHDSADLDGALEKHAEAEELRRTIVESQPLTPKASVHLESLLDLGASTDRVAHIYDQSGKLAKAIDYHRESYRIAKLLLSVRPGSGQYRRDFALAASRLGYDFQKKKDSEEALRYYREGEATLRDLVELAPSSKRYRYDWAIALTDLGDLFASTEEFRAAEKHYEDSLRELGEVIKLDQNDPLTIGQRIVTENALAEMYKAYQKPREALRWYKSALRLAEEKIRRWPNVPNQHYARAILLSNTSEILQSIDPEESREYFDRACEELRQLVERHPADKRFQQTLEVLMSTKQSDSRTEEAQSGPGK